MATAYTVTKGDGNGDLPPLVFVHGAWHARWCWEEHFTAYFAARGFTSYALDLAGHGQSPGNLRRTSIGRYVADVREVVEGLRSAPVLIGHSMGGLVVQKYLERYDARAGVLVASVPRRGAIGATVRVAVRHPVAFLRANMTFSLGPIVDDPERARSMLFGPEMDAGLARTYAERLQDESYLAYLQMIAWLPRPSRIAAPMLVVGAEDDALFPPHEIHATARAYGSEAVVFDRMGHDMMLEPRWMDVADAITAWLTEQRF